MIRLSCRVECILLLVWMSRICHFFRTYLCVLGEGILDGVIISVD